ncbi:hypothetical protein MPSEU_000967200 [Mayamaea pseudoterrestris]|nr:hypothetical protein MPSEU_000967200 [Mayamaea pseudoterrestris]
MSTSIIPTTTMRAAEVPANANEGCVGPSSEKAGKASACDGCPSQAACSSGQFQQDQAVVQDETMRLQTALGNVSNVVLVLSGKGGVGKSTVASQLCHTLASQGYAVGLLDVDLCGPSAPRMVLGNAAYQQEIHKAGSGAWTPIYVKPHNLAVMSISFMLQDPNQAVVWRGPRKNALIQQFLTEVDWTGDTDGLDYLIIDTPPGTSDEHISTVQYLQRANAVAGAIVVTTPEEVSLADVRKELNFCTKTNVKVLGIVENMSTYQTQLSKCSFVNPEGTDCTDAVLSKLKETCPEMLDMIVNSDVFSTTHGGAEKMANDYGAPFWGTLPLDPDLLKACEDGKAFCELKKDAVAAKALVELARKLTVALPVDMST